MNLSKSLSSFPEAKQKLTLSLGFIISLGFGAYQFGQQSSAIPESQLKQAEKVQQIEVTLAKVSTILETMQKHQEENTKSIRDIQNKNHQINGEIQVISSKLKASK